MRRPLAQRATSRGGLAVLLVVAALIAASAAVCQVWTRLRAIEYGYRISDATRQQVQLLEANRRLQLEAALLSSPQRIAGEVAELGLRPPTPEQVRRLRWGDDPRLRPRGKPAPLARFGP
jgi:cell division protein FtsL